MIFLLYAPVYLLFGTVLGTVQWLAFRPWLRDARLWLAASASGTLVAVWTSVHYELFDLYVARNYELDSILVGSTFGAALGLTQWLALRRWLPHAYLWIYANVLGWTAGSVLSDFVNFPGDAPWIVWLNLLLLLLPGLAASLLALAWLTHVPAHNNPPDVLNRTHS
jgi:hypothetical protein